MKHIPRISSFLVIPLAVHLAVACTTKTFEDPGEGEDAAAGEGGEDSSGDGTGGDEGETGTGGEESGGQGGASDGGTGGDSTGTGGEESGSGGDTSGSGGSTSAPLALGDSCGDGADCESGFCADGVCCAEACDGVCEQCNGSGACVMPGSDSACGFSGCGSADDGNECTEVGISLDANECKAFGECYVEADCFDSVPARTTCNGASSDHDFCDGSGECVTPTVACDYQNTPAVEPPCLVGSQICCETFPHMADKFVECKSIADCKGSANSDAIRFECRGHDDCREGEYCSITVQQGTDMLSCKTTGETNVRLSFSSVRQLCDDGAGNTSVCSNGLACNYKADWLSDLTFCALP